MILRHAGKVTIMEQIPPKAPDKDSMTWETEWTTKRTIEVPAWKSQHLSFFLLSWRTLLFIELNTVGRFFAKDTIYFPANTQRRRATSLQRRCNVTTLQRRCNDVVLTLCVYWVCGFFPAGTQRWNSADSTLIQRLDFESTLNRRCFNVAYLLSFLYSCTPIPFSKTKRFDCMGVFFFWFYSRLLYSLKMYQFPLNIRR